MDAGQVLPIFCELVQPEAKTNQQSPGGFVGLPLVASHPSTMHAFWDLIPNVAGLLLRGSPWDYFNVHWNGSNLLHTAVALLSFKLQEVASSLLNLLCLSLQSQLTFQLLGKMVLCKAGFGGYTKNRVFTKYSVDLPEHAGLETYICMPKFSFPNGPRKGCICGTSFSLTWILS